MPAEGSSIGVAAAARTRTTPATSYGNQPLHDSSVESQIHVKNGLTQDKNAADQQPERYSCQVDTRVGWSQYCTNLSSDSCVNDAAKDATPLTPTCHGNSCRLGLLWVWPKFCQGILSVGREVLLTVRGSFAVQIQCRDVRWGAGMRTSSLRDVVLMCRQAMSCQHVAAWRGTRSHRLLQLAHQAQRCLC